MQSPDDEFASFAAARKPVAKKRAPAAPRSKALASVEQPWVYPPKTKRMKLFRITMVRDLKHTFIVSTYAYDKNGAIRDVNGVGGAEAVKAVEAEQ